MYVCMYIRMYVCMYVCMMYIHTGMSILTKNNSGGGLTAAAVRHSSVHEVVAERWAPPEILSAGQHTYAHVMSRMLTYADKSKHWGRLRSYRYR
jgi:hypothetical protein